MVYERSSALATLKQPFPKSNAAQRKLCAKFTGIRHSLYCHDKGVVMVVALATIDSDLLYHLVL